MHYLLVAIGGALGALGRMLVGGLLTQRLGPDLPYGTFAVNITGSFLLGFILTLSVERAVVPNEGRLFFAVGFLGAYTTFSTFSWETMRLIHTGNHWAGIWNVVLSVIGGLVAVLAGMFLARAF